MNIDILIFIAFLLANLGIGLFFGRGVKTIKDYALGGRKFSTGTLVSTIIATWIGGDYLFITLSQVYTTGLHYAIACCGMVICFLLTAYVFIPRMSEFLGNISVAETMGNLYGEKVRIISALAGSIAAAGFIAVQFKVFGDIFKLYAGLSNNYAIIGAAIIVVLYSAFGGIKSIAITDVVQFFTFGVLIPVLGIIIWNDCSNSTNCNLLAIPDESIFNYKNFIGYSNPKFWELIFLLFLFAIPDLNPAIFQRIVIGRTTAEVKKAFTISAFLLLLILCGMSWVGFLLFNLNPDLQPDSLVHYIINNYAHTGLRSFILVGIIAMCMSTADSNINSSSVLLTHDFCYPLGIKLRNELTLSKIISLLIGIFAIFLALLDYDLLYIVFMTQSFYLPIVTLPLIMAIMGFRSTSKSVLIGMFAGVTTVIIWRIFYMDTGIDSIIPGMIANLIALMSSHYLLKQPGGWIIKKNNNLENEHKYNSKTLFERLKYSFYNFRLINFLKNNSPKNELTYTGFGIFCIISTICTMYSMSYFDKDGNLLLLYESMLILSIGFMTFPIWPQSLKKDVIIQTLWNFGIFYLLIFSSSFFLILGNFNHLQFLVFAINIIVTAILTRWNLALSMILIGIYLSSKFYKFYTGMNEIYINIDSTWFILYSLLLGGATIIVLLKPKQEQEELSEERADHLIDQISYHQQELEKALKLKNEFIRNVSHEYHAPMTGVISTAETLWEGYDKLSDKLRRSAAENIYKSAIRLDSFDTNIRDLSKLSNPQSELNLTNFNLSELVAKRIEVCKKLYIEDQDKDQYQFSTNIEIDIIVDADEYYLKQTLDNLIINAITYCKKGKIKIILRKEINLIKFTIADEGIGIPQEELEDIFGSFTVSSTTRTPAGGRGVGLALCKKVIELHRGDIKAQSDDGITTFTFTIPINPLENDNSINDETIKIAKSLVSQGVEVKKITKATGLKKVQVEKLKDKK